MQKEKLILALLINVYKFAFHINTMKIEINASSETQGLLAGTMRYFRASDIFG